jgi:hypothetical protein
MLLLLSDLVSVRCFEILILYLYPTHANLVVFPSPFNKRQWVICSPAYFLFEFAYDHAVI